MPTERGVRQARADCNRTFPNCSISNGCVDPVEVDQTFTMPDGRILTIRAGLSADGKMEIWQLLVDEYPETYQEGYQRAFSRYVAEECGIWSRITFRIFSGEFCP